jgi:multidrug efflux system outer membrane protein
MERPPPTLSGYRPTVKLVSLLAPALLCAALSASTAARGQTGAAGSPPSTASALVAANPILPPPPRLDDPMLVPVPAPARIIGSWDDAISMLNARSLDIRNAADVVRVAEAQWRIALAEMIPSLSGQATVAHLQYLERPKAGGGSGVINGSQVVTSSSTSLNTTVSFQQYLLNIEDVHAIVTARVSVEAMQLSADDLRRTLALGAANAIVAVVAAERVGEINRVGLRNALEQLVLTQTKAKDGAATGLDIERTQANVDAARATLVTGDESLREAREALGLVLGYPEQIGVFAGLNLDRLVSGALSSCQTREDLHDRRDYQSLVKLQEVAQRNITDVREQYLPTINLTSGLTGIENPAGSYPTTTWNVTGILNIPIWDGGTRIGNMRNNEALLDEAKNAVLALERTATVAVLQAKRGVEVALLSQQVADRARTTAANIDRMTEATYRAGGVGITSLDLVIASEALRTAEINLAVRDATLVQAKVTAALTLSTCHW